MAKTTSGTPRKVALTLDSLGDLSSGQAGVAINAALAAAIRDTEDRGSDKKARKVVIEIELKKLGDENVTATVRAKTTIPPYQTEQTVGNLRPNGGPWLIGHTPPDEVIKSRGQQILAAVYSLAPRLVRYAVVDDLDLSEQFGEAPWCQVQTDPKIGMTDADADRLIELLK